MLMIRSNSHLDNQFINTVVPPVMPVSKAASLMGHSCSRFIGIRLQPSPGWHWRELRDGSIGSMGRAGLVLQLTGLMFSAIQCP